MFKSADPIKCRFNENNYISKNDLGCEAMRTFAPRSTERDSIVLINLEEHLGTIAGAVCGTLGLLLAVFAFLLWRSVPLHLL